MKTWTCSAVLGIVFSALIINSAYADNAAGMIKTMKGEVNVVRGGVLVQATLGMPLVATDKITTGSNSSVGITLQDGTLLAFGANSASELNEYSFDSVSHEGNILISMVKGSMRFVSGLLGKHNPSSVSIHTATATIGLRGTDFIVSVEGGK